MRVIVVCVSAWLVSSCVASGGSTRIEPPIEVVSDSIVVPGEISDDFQFLRQPGNIPRFFEEPSILQSWSMGRRRALSYTFFDGLQADNWWPSDLGLHTFPSAKDAWDTSIDEIASQIGFSVSHTETFFGGEVGPTLYWLESPRELSVGEAGWYADWIVSNYPDVVTYVSPNRLYS